MALFKQQVYDRIGTLKLKEVFPYIKEFFYENGKKKININEFLVNVQSLRLRTFYQSGVLCPCCNTEATYFAVESNSPAHGYHLNLYGKNKEGEDVIFTHDHILARALGGKDNLDNTQTMCGPCNWSKGRLESNLSVAIIANDIEKTHLYEKQLNVLKEKISINYNQQQVQRKKNII